MPSQPRGEFRFTVIRCFAGLLGVLLGVWFALIGMKYPCGDYGKQICWNQQAAQCDACQEWLHTKCLNISPSDYSILQQSDDPWICPSCYCSFANCSTISIASRSDSSVESAPGVTIASSPSGLRLYYCNSRSLLPKMDDVRAAVALGRFDILAFTETWFDIGTHPCEISIPYCIGTGLDVVAVCVSSSTTPFRLCHNPWISLLNSTLLQLEPRKVCWWLFNIVLQE